jgi:hypothetical protein
MKKHLLTIVVTITFLGIQAQTQLNLGYARTLTSSNANIYDMVTDPSGNLYVAGDFINTVDFATDLSTLNLTAVGDADGFIAKYNSTGVLQWVKQIGGSSDDKVAKVSLIGNTILLAGNFISTTNFDVTGSTPLNLTSYGASDVFIAGYDITSGNNTFYKQIGSAAGGEYAQGITFNSTSTFFVAVSGDQAIMYDQANPAATVVPTNNFLVNHFLVAKYNIADGTYASTKYYLDAANDNQITDIIHGAGGNGIFILGTFKGTVDFDQSLSIVSKTSNGGSDIFLASIDGVTAALNWVTTFGTTSSGEVPRDLNRIAANNFGLNSAYLTVAGNFSGSLTIGAATNDTTLLCNGAYDGFVAKFDFSGALIRAHQFGGINNEYEYISSVVADGSPRSGMLVIGQMRGTFDADITSGVKNISTLNVNNSDIFFANYDMLNDTLIFAHTIGNSDINTEFAAATAVSNSGSPTVYYIGGAIYNPVDFDLVNNNGIIGTANQYDAFITKYERCNKPQKPNAVSSTSFTVAQGTSVQLYALGTNFEVIQYFDSNGNIVTNTPGLFTITGAYSQILNIETTNYAPGTYTFTAYATGCANSALPVVFTITITASTVGLNDLEQQSYMIYPNPIQQIVTINSPTVLKNITITDVLGKVVLNKNVNNISESVDISNLQSGIYFLTVNGITKKIIKE